MTSDDQIWPGSGPVPGGPPEPAEQILSLRDVRVEFSSTSGLPGRRRHRVLRALDGVSLDVRAGESVAVVGESGSGKTTLGRVICRLQDIAGGQVAFRGQDLTALRGQELAGFRRSVQMVFQDPYSSLDPRVRVGPIVAEPLKVNRIGTAAERRTKVAGLLDTVGLPASLTDSFPHELSGGQRQRVAIARALALSPQLIVADEPTSALDVSAQAQILSLLDRLRHELGLSLIYITHNLPTAAYVADRAVVMYLGQIIKAGPVADVLLGPEHPYTAALCAAAPTLDGLIPEQSGGQPLAALGELPDPANPPSGCRFHPRCWLRPQVPDPARCEQQQPDLPGTGGAAAGDGGAAGQGAARHRAACHFSQLLQDRPAMPGWPEPGRDE